jgi:carbon monoxide dehydrogenase subunit G
VSEAHKTVTIDATAEKVFAFLGDPQNIAACSTSAPEVFEGRTGNTFRVVCNVLTRTFDETVTVTRSDLPPKSTPHRRYQLQHSFAGGVNGTVIWTLEAQDIQTDTSVDIEYRVAGTLVDKALKGLVLKATVQRQLDRMLENMKHMLEARPA